MSKRSRQLELIRLVDPPGNEKTASADGYFGPHEHYLEVEVSYDDGTNIFSGNRSRRGYYVSAAPIYHQKSGTGTTKGYLLFSGKKLLVAEAKRFSEKALDAAAVAAKQHPDYEHLKAAVLEKHNLTVA